MIYTVVILQDNEYARLECATMEDKMFEVTIDE